MCILFFFDTTIKIQLIFVIFYNGLKDVYFKYGITHWLYSKLEGKKRQYETRILCCVGLVNLPKEAKKCSYINISCMLILGS